MTPVSRRKLDTKVEERLVAILVSELCKISEQEKLMPLINNLLSRSKNIMIAKRGEL